MTLAEHFVTAVRAADPAAYKSLCSPESRHSVNIGSARGALHSGDEIEIALCAVVTCDGAQIARVNEYVDSAAAAPLLRAVFASQ